MRDKILFTYNPNAGTKKIVGKLNDVVYELLDEQCDLVLSPTRKRNDAKEAVSAYLREGNCVKVVCSGGDGTLHEVVEGLMESEPEKRVPIVYLPAGSTNDFGYSMCLPKDIVEAAKLSKTGIPYSCDIGCFNGKYVVYTAAFGLFSDVSYATSQSLKNVLGHAAYLLNGAGALANIERVNATITLPDETIEGTFIMGMVVSSSSIGGFRGITGPDVRLNDGKFELFLIREPSPLQVAGLLNDIRKRNFDNPLIVFRHITEAAFEFEEEVAWTIDGEYGGACLQAHMSVKKHAVTFMVPRETMGLLAIDD
ncbi:MAG: YegS/Rv2252/BmrU family lipid kinase [Lachnospiraceae bacterium]|nr:YegS/Rv2252/BmrU family lipid kinase [Lachnospiraceae bacterium]